MRYTSSAGPQPLLPLVQHAPDEQGNGQPESDDGQVVIHAGPISSRHNQQPPRPKRHEEQAEYLSDTPRGCAAGWILHRRLPGEAHRGHGEASGGRDCAPTGHAGVSDHRGREEHRVDDWLATWRAVAHGATTGAYPRVRRGRQGSAARHGLPTVAYEPLGTLDQLLDLAPHRIAAL